MLSTTLACLKAWSFRIHGTQNSTDRLVARAISFVISIGMKRLKAEDQIIAYSLIQEFSSVNEWKSLVSSELVTEDENEFVEECFDCLLSGSDEAKQTCLCSLSLLAHVKGWIWTYNHMILQRIWPLIQRKNNVLLAMRVIG